MKYSVVWTPSARRILAELWLSAEDKSQIQQAADAMERTLANDPLNAGESRVVNIRIIVESPLAAYFDVDPLDLRVKVWRIWRIRGR